MDGLILLLVMQGYKASAKTPTAALLFVIRTVLNFEGEDQRVQKGLYIMTKNLKKISSIGFPILCILLFVLTFESCIDNLYGTNGHEYLNVTFDKSKINGTFLQYYIDSVLNKGIIFPDSIKSKFYISTEQHNLNENQKLIHFRKVPEEWYLIGLEINPCWIEAVYNPRLRDEAIFDKKAISVQEGERIKNRFQTEILNESELYSKQNRINDSMVNIK